MSGMEQNHQGYLEISREDLRCNARLIREQIKVPIIGVVKCDGYGVSALEAVQAWRGAGVTMFAVSDPEEALSLRASDVSEEILLLAPVARPELIRQLAERNIILTVTDADCAARYSKEIGGCVRVHIAIDTGMGRFGLHWADRQEVLSLYHQPGLQVEGIFSHFAASFAPSDRMTRLQLERFLDLCGFLERQGVKTGLRHIANSCAALRYPETWLDGVRIGSALVGRLPVTVPLKLRRVGVYKAMVIQRRVLKKGDTTGYGAICRLKRDTEIAVVALGHQSGFGLLHQPQSFRLCDLMRHILHLCRAMQNPPVVWYQGRALPVVGRIGSQYTLVDVKDTDLRPGDWVCANTDLMLPAPHRKYI